MTESGWLMLNGSVPEHPKPDSHWAIIEESGTWLNATLSSWLVVVQVRLHTSFSNGLSQDVKEKAKKEIM